MQPLHGVHSRLGRRALKRRLVLEPRPEDERDRGLAAAGVHAERNEARRVCEAGGALAPVAETVVLVADGAQIAVRPALRVGVAEVLLQGRLDLHRLLFRHEGLHAHAVRARGQGSVPRAVVVRDAGEPLVVDAGHAVRGREAVGVGLAVARVALRDQALVEDGLVRLVDVVRRAARRGDLCLHEAAAERGADGRRHNREPLVELVQLGELPAAGNGLTDDHGGRGHVLLRRRTGLAVRDDVEHSTVGVLLDGLDEALDNGRAQSAVTRRVAPVRGVGLVELQRHRLDGGVGEVLAQVARRNCATGAHTGEAPAVLEVGILVQRLAVLVDSTEGARVREGRAHAERRLRNEVAALVLGAQSSGARREGGEELLGEARLAGEARRGAALLAALRHAVLLLTVALDGVESSTLHSAGRALHSGALGTRLHLARVLAVLAARHLAVRRRLRLTVAPDGREQTLLHLARRAHHGLRLRRARLQAARVVAGLAALRLTLCRAGLLVARHVREPAAPPHLAHRALNRGRDAARLRVASVARVLAAREAAVVVGVVLVALNRVEVRALHVAGRARHDCRLGARLHTAPVSQAAQLDALVSRRVLVTLNRRVVGPVNRVHGTRDSGRRRASLRSTCVDLGRNSRCRRQGNNRSQHGLWCSPMKYRYCSFYN
eukprot:Rhum_TRINITY_DN22766_c0_g1::Rhum_TRINITY_DN22766_c0_g1_i1::g.176055::m.176055